MKNPNLTKKLVIGLRLKIWAEKNFISLAELSRKLGFNARQQLYDYINGKSFIGSEILIKLADLGCDINWLLNGTPSASSVKEPEVPYSAAIDERLKSLEERLDHLEKMNNKWQHYSAEVLNQYKTDCQGKDEMIARLSVQFVTLVAANHAADKLDCGKDKISK